MQDEIHSFIDTLQEYVSICNKIPHHIPLNHQDEKRIWEMLLWQAEIIKDLLMKIENKKKEEHNE